LTLELALFKIQVQVSSASSNAHSSQEPPDQNRLNSYKKFCNWSACLLQTPELNNFKHAVLWDVRC